jgi:hypothetical protein
MKPKEVPDMDMGPLAPPLVPMLSSPHVAGHDSDTW